MGVLSFCEDRYLGTSGKWLLTPAGHIRNIGDDWDDQMGCIEVSGPGKLDENSRLKLDIGKINTDQRWKHESGSLQNTIGGMKCLDIKETGDVTHDLLELNNCKNSAEAQWMVTPDGQFRAREREMCLGILPGQLMTTSFPNTMSCMAPTLNGEGVALLHRCPHVTQRWELNDFQQIWNSASDRCLDAVPQDEALECSLWDKLTHQCINSPAPRGWKLVTSTCTADRGL